MKNAVFIETEIAPVYTEILWRELLIIAHLTKYWLITPTN